MNVETEKARDKLQLRRTKAETLLARLRDRQLRLAAVGKITDSARYATRATKVRGLTAG
ncbi:MAG: hypothetical protein GVY24_00335 [Planctomycetes bacterium]|jgi:phosphopentomutase|nr:hypothetical protein [Planctomycetota bacterium]